MASGEQYRHLLEQELTNSRRMYALESRCQFCQKKPVYGAKVGATRILQAGDLVAQVEFYGRTGRYFDPRYFEIYILGFECQEEDSLHKMAVVLVVGGQVGKTPDTAPAQKTKLAVQNLIKLEQWAQLENYEQDNIREKGARYNRKHEYHHLNNGFLDTIGSFGT